MTRHIGFWPHRSTPCWRDIAVTGLFSFIAAFNISPQSSEHAPNTFLTRTHSLLTTTPGDYPSQNLVLNSFIDINQFTRFYYSSGLIFPEPRLKLIYRHQINYICPSVKPWHRPALELMCEYLHTVTAVVKDIGGAVPTTSRAGLPDLRLAHIRSRIRKSSNSGLPLHRSLFYWNLPTPVSPKCSTGIVDFPVQLYTLVKQVLTIVKLFSPVFGQFKAHAFELLKCLWFEFCCPQMLALFH